MSQQQHRFYFWALAPVALLQGGLQSTGRITFGSENLQGGFALPSSSFAGVFSSQAAPSPATSRCPRAGAGLGPGHSVCSHTCSLWDLPKGAVLGERGRGVILDRNPQLRSQAERRWLRTHFLCPYSPRTGALRVRGVGVSTRPSPCTARLSPMSLHRHQQLVAQLLRDRGHRAAGARQPPPPLGFSVWAGAQSGASAQDRHPRAAAESRPCHDQLVHQEPPWQWLWFAATSRAALPPVLPPTLQPRQELRAAMVQLGGSGTPRAQLQLPPAQGWPSCAWLPCCRLFGAVPRRWHPWLAQPGCRVLWLPLQPGHPPSHPALPQHRDSVPGRGLPQLPWLPSQAPAPLFAPVTRTRWGSDSLTLLWSASRSHPATAPGPHPKDAQRPLWHPVCHGDCPLTAVRLQRCPCASSGVTVQEPPCQHPAQERDALQETRLWSGPAPQTQ